MTTAATKPLCWLSVLAALGTHPVIAQETAWTPLSFSGEHVIFVLGGPETKDGSRQITLALVPPAGSQTFEGREVGFFLNFYTVDCTAWTSHHHTVQVFGADAAIFSQGDPEQPEQAIGSTGGTMDLAAQLKCRADPPSVSGAVPQDRLIEAADALRGSRGG
jgi:hypothetical protein